MKYPRQHKQMILLRNYYQDLLDDIAVGAISCPLCHDNIGGNMHCKDCVWVKETGDYCGNNISYNVSDLRSGLSYIPKQILTKWRKQRVKQLNEWINK